MEQGQEIVVQMGPSAFSFKYGICQQCLANGEMETESSLKVESHLQLFFVTVHPEDNPAFASETKGEGTW